MKRTIPILAAATGLGAIGSGSLMLINPVEWYVSLPGLTTIGSFNYHVIRFAGMVHIFFGACLLVGVTMHAQRTYLWVLGTASLVAIAAFEAQTLNMGVCGSQQLVIGLVFTCLLPAIGLGMCVWSHVLAPRTFVRNT